ncbi:putative biotin synthesis protein BioC [Roseobacter sp. SK209-2-6]|uniref:pimeloyl-ACP methyl esterase BioG family protein n=1 Tax=Roseobacter sp. SK209-2-6 TaxID=388739 RepID=UPI0000F3ED0A|nr:pimeloyl-ACP methyl esterase BioG family protein [Roseobacter sp. SK209-2-6]EBA15594.1 putative biotin synthesis protein BioC [Roseobacter sp. SK209-2-6]
MEFRWIKSGQRQTLGRSGAPSQGEGQVLPGLPSGRNPEAIVVFGGWAVGPEVFQRLTGAQDVIFASDYRDLEAELPDLTGYERVSLLAWSFGVSAYAHWQQGRKDPFHRKVAVNGSLTPVSRTRGVPPVAMAKTTETLSQSAYQLFLARVFGAGRPETVIDVEARRAELQAVARRGDAPVVDFDKIWISRSDKIFPAANLNRAWAGSNVQEIDAPHAPFDRFSSWEELLS